MKDSITLYSTPGCPKCASLKMWLKARNIEYNETYDEQPLLDRGLLQHPILEVNGEFLTMPEAKDWIQKHS